MKKKLLVFGTRLAAVNLSIQMDEKQKLGV